jgi:secondary thiamine-phosphate synthase enzyme
MSASAVPESKMITSPAKAESGPSIPGIKSFVRIADWMTNEKFEFINMTDRINEIVSKSGVKDGIVHLQSLHTTAAVFINEWQDALLHDIGTVLEQFVGNDERWRHDDPAYSDCERKNAASHLRGFVLGPSVSLQVRNTKVLLGTWQSIILAELDGPRSRSVSVQVMGV